MSQAQIFLGGEAHFGYSKPTNLAYSLRYAYNEVNGVFSQNFYLTMGYKKKRHYIKAKIGLDILGYQLHSLNGYTSADFFEHLKPGLPVLDKTDAQLIYVDYSIGYGFDVTKKLNIALSGHYLRNVRSHYDHRYLFTNTTAPYRELHVEFISFDANRKGFGEPSHFAGSMEMSYQLAKNTKIGGSYLLGLTDFSSGFLGFRNNTRRTQNFSIFLYQNFWTFK